MSEFLYLNVLRISRRLIFVFSLLFPHFFRGFCPNLLLHRNFSAAPPKVPFFSVSRGRFLFFPAFSFPNRLPPRNFFEILRFLWAFFPTRRNSFRDLFSVLRGIFRRLLCHSPTVFLLIRIYLGLISKPPLPLNFPVDLYFSAARGCRFSAFFPSWLSFPRLTAVLYCLSSAHSMFQSRFAVSTLISLPLPPPPPQPVSLRKGVCPPSG